MCPMCTCAAMRSPASPCHRRPVTQAALHIDDHPPAVEALKWLRPDEPDAAVPALASSVVLELHGPPGTAQNTSRQLEPGPGVGVDDANTAVRLVVQDGPAAPFITVPLPCAAAGDGAEAVAGPGACTLAAFVRLASVGLAVGGSPVAWCRACGNTAAAACAMDAARWVQAGIQSPGEAA